METPKGCMVLFKDGITLEQTAAIFAGLQTCVGVESVTPTTPAHELVDVVRKKADAFKRVVEFATQEFSQ